MKSLLLTLGVSVALTVSPVCFADTASSNDNLDFKKPYQLYLAAVKERQFGQALLYAQEALSAGEQMLDATSDDLLSLRFNYANALVANRKFEEAYDVLTALEDAYIKRDGEVSVNTLNVRLERFYVVASLPVYDRKMISKKNAIGKELVNLVEALSEQNPIAEANYWAALMSILQRSNTGFQSMRRMISLAEKAEEIMLKALGPTDSRVIEAQFYLAKLYKSDRKLNHSAEKFEAIVTVVEDSVDFTHPWVLSAHAQLVDIYETQGQRDAATEHCVAIAKMTPWDDSILEPTPLFRVNPVYPSNYARTRKEGFVIVEFDIDEYGFVTKPRVLESQGGARFESATLKALEKWRYTPKFEDGEVKIAENRRVQMDFTIGS